MKEAGRSDFADVGLHAELTVLDDTEISYAVDRHDNGQHDFNPLKPSVIMWLHFECSSPYRPNLHFQFQTFEHSQAERRMSDIKNGRLDLYGKV